MLTQIQKRYNCQVNLEYQDYIQNQKEVENMTAKKTKTIKTSKVDDSEELEESKNSKNSDKSDKDVKVENTNKIIEFVDKTFPDLDKNEKKTIIGRVYTLLNKK